jgi:predicted aldo/keto reductase-like oxidoreductase
MSDDKKPVLDRRDFLKLGGTATAALLAGAALPSSAAALPSPSNPATPASLPTRNLGKTGYRVGLFSLGGQAAVEQPNNQAVAVSIVERALDLGVNYLDTAAAYGRGISQGYIGQVMKRRRKEAFLATKTHDRTRDGSLRLLDQSLTLLQTDHVDLWQLHHLDTMDDVDQIFAKGGAIDAMLRAREQKQVRFLGITGHRDPDVLVEAIRRFPFDNILMAVNAADPHHLSFRSKLLPLAVEKEMGIVGMKIPARGRILSSPATTTSPYKFPEGMKPGTLAMRDALYYVLSLPVSTVIIGCDTVAQLEENVRLAREFTPLSESQMAAVAEKTEPIARQALFFRRWS